MKLSEIIKSEEYQPRFLLPEHSLMIESDYFPTESLYLIKTGRNKEYNNLKDASEKFARVINYTPFQKSRPFQKSILIDISDKVQQIGKKFEFKEIANTPVTVGITEDGKPLQIYTDICALMRTPEDKNTLSLFANLAFAYFSNMDYQHVKDFQKNNVERSGLRMIGESAPLEGNPKTPRWIEAPHTITRQIKPDKYSNRIVTYGIADGAIVLTDFVLNKMSGQKKSAEEGMHIFKRSPDVQISSGKSPASIIPYDDVREGLEFVRRISKKLDADALYLGDLPVEKTGNILISSNEKSEKPRIDYSSAANLLMNLAIRAVDLHFSCQAYEKIFAK